MSRVETDGMAARRHAITIMRYWHDLGYTQVRAKAELVTKEIEIKGPRDGRVVDKFKQSNWGIVSNLVNGSPPTKKTQRLA